MLFVLVVAVQQNINNFDMKNAKVSFIKIVINYALFYHKFKFRGFLNSSFVVGFAKQIIFLNGQEICGVRCLACSNTFD